MRAPFWIVVLAVAASFLAWETWSAWNAPASQPLPPAAGFALPQRPASADNASRAAELAGQVAVIAVKPLFRADRQPYFENAAAAPQRNYEGELSRLTLVGVVLQGDQRKGLVLGTLGGRPERWEVGAGDSLPGFAVREVQADGLLLAADGREFLLPLYGGPPKGQAPGSLRTETGIPAAAAQPQPGMPLSIPGAPVPPSMQPPAGRAAPQPGIPASPFGGRSTLRPPRTAPYQR